MKLIRTTGLVLSLALMIAPATAALAKPISTYHADFNVGGAGDVLSIEFDDAGVKSVSLLLSCGEGNVLSFESTAVTGSFVAVGPKADRFDVSASFTADFIDCDGSRAVVDRFVSVSDFVATGSTVRSRDRNTGTRTLTIPVEAQVSLFPMPNQPLAGTLTETISKG